MTESEAIKQTQEYLASLGHHLTVEEIRRLYELIRGHLVS